MKQELKKDPLLEKISEFDSFVRENKNKLIYSIGAIVVIVVISILLINSKRTANRKASGDLGIAQIAISQGDIDNAILQLEDLTRKYAGTRSAGMGIILLANTYLTQLDYENAGKYFQAYLDEYKDDKLIVSSAYNGLGICAEQNEDFQAAAEYFGKSSENSAYKFQEHEAKINSARNYIKVGDIKKAGQMINNILDEEMSKENQDKAEILDAQIRVLNVE